MLPLRFSLGAFAVLAFGAAAACSSSSSSNNAKDAGGGDDASSTGPDATNPLMINATCGLLSMVGGGSSMMCPMGQACCTMISLSPSASCVAAGQCAGGISSECTKGPDCSGGQVCCAGAADGGAMMAMDAAAAGMGGLGGLGNFDPSMFSTTCQASCTPTQTQQCASDTECPSGQTCQSLGGGAGGGLGGLIMLPSVCMAPRPDAGTPTPEAGGPTPDTGSPTTPDADMSDVAAGD